MKSRTEKLQLLYISDGARVMKVRRESTSISLVAASAAEDD